MPHRRRRIVARRLRNSAARLGRRVALAVGGLLVATSGFSSAEDAPLPEVLPAPHTVDVEAKQRVFELGLPITFHTGTSPIQFADLDYAHPRHFDRVAIAFPDLKMVLAHMAHPWQETTIAVIRKHPNLYADISALFYRPWSFYNCMRLAQEWGVLHKLLFGSDYLVTTPQENIDALRNANRIVEGTNLPRISEAAMEEIIHRDALSLLGLAD